ncbi:MAG: hypothetical protein GXP54_12080 [Deltaproteobacteria bacterium]|nr:hypothetical protein [Deltaproteobacteria bacterium]
MKRNRKALARGFLSSRDLPGLTQWSRDTYSSMGILFSLTNDPDDLIVWRAVEAVGHVAADKWKGRPEAVRDFVRRLLWLMNDESGGLGWHAPEAVAEIVYNIPELVEEFGHLLPSFLVEEPFERGAHHALSRIGHMMPSQLSGSVDTLARSLDDPDAGIRFHTLEALEHLGDDVLTDARTRLADDRSAVQVYNFDTGQLNEREAGEPARRLAGRMGIGISG